MTEFLFPDNTVLCNFAAVDRLDLLKAVLGGRGRWTEAVAYEAGSSARVLPALRGLGGSGWLDEPIEIVEDCDVLAIERIRRAVFGGTEDEPGLVRPYISPHVDPWYGSRPGAAVPRGGGRCARQRGRAAAGAGADSPAAGCHEGQRATGRVPRHAP